MLLFMPESERKLVQERVRDGSVRSCNRFLAPIPPIVSNAVIVPFVLHFGYGVNLPIPLMMLTVGIGEVVSCGVVGLILQTALLKYKNVIFRSQRTV